jgi:hypothetical protein
VIPAGVIPAGVIPAGVILAHAESLLQEATLVALRADAGQVALRMVPGVPGRSLVEAAHGRY